MNIEPSRIGLRHLLPTHLFSRYIIMAPFTKTWYKSLRYEKLSAHELGSLETMKTGGPTTYRWIIYTFVLLCSSIALSSLGFYAGFNATSSCDCHVPPDWCKIRLCNIINHKKD